jgi:hypothetical protein
LTGDLRCSEKKKCVLLEIELSISPSKRLKIHFYTVYTRRFLFYFSFSKGTRIDNLPPASFILIKGGIMKKKFEKNTKYTSSDRKFKIIEKCTKLQTLDGKTYLFSG